MTPILIVPTKFKYWVVKSGSTKKSSIHLSFQLNMANVDKSNKDVHIRHHRRLIPSWLLDQTD